VFLKNDRYEILTPTGFNSFVGLDIKTHSGYFDFVFSDSSTIRVSKLHDFKTEKGWISASRLRKGSTIISSSGESLKVTSKLLSKGKEVLYDPVEVSGGHSYISNNVVSHNCSASFLLLDEVAFVPTNQFEEFFESTYPTISSGEETKIAMVSTPKGFNHFHKIYKDAEEGRSNFKAMTILWDEVPGRDEAFKRETIANIGEDRWLQEFEAGWIGATGSLIAPSIVKNLVFKTPIAEHNHFKIYENPIEGHTYALTADCSEGVGADYSAMNIIDITKKPFKQVCTFYDNRTLAIHMPELIYRMAKKYNEAFVLIEINSVGKQVADLLHWDYAYENIAWVGEGRRGQVLMGGNSQQQQNGLRTTKQTKAIGCSNLKTLVEERILEISDFGTIQELSTFIKKGGSFQADEGSHDDSVMSLVVFAWMTTQDYFKALTDNDMRARAVAQLEERMMDNLTPFIEVVNGIDEIIEEKVVDKQGIVWQTWSV
jgi:hypothetical protein